MILKASHVRFVEPLICEDEKRTKCDASTDTEEYALGADELDDGGGAEGTYYIGHDAGEETCCCHSAYPLWFPAGELDDGGHADEAEALI